MVNYKIKKTTIIMSLTAPQKNALSDFKDRDLNYKMLKDAQRCA